MSDYLTVLKLGIKVHLESWQAKEIADLIEQLQQRNNELAATVERLREAILDYQNKNHDLNILLAAAVATPAANLNHVKREVAKEAWFNAYDTLEQHIRNDKVITSHSMTDLADEYANQRYPDKE